MKRTSQSFQAALVGSKVLSELAKGRQRAIERARQIGAANAMQVMALAVIDAQAGRSVRGRAGRISRKLGGLLTERSVKRIMDRLSSVSDSIRHNAGNFMEVPHASEK